MAYIFSDSFDFYTTIADANGWWDSSINWQLSTPRFSGQSFGNISSASTTYLSKSSGSNDATHHIVISWWAFNVTGTNAQGTGIQLLDGVTPQCTLVFHGDGSVVLKSGGAGGSALATWNNGYIPTVWTALEIEITINNTTGSIAIRKEGNPTPVFSATGLNTRGGTANNYANKLAIVSFAAVGTGIHKIDDLLWFNTTGAAPNTWVGDVRGYQLMPTGDVSKQFAPSPSVSATTPFGVNTTTVHATGQGNMVPFTAPYTGTIGTAIVSVNVGGTGNMKCAIYDANRSAVVGSASNALVNPVTGPNTVTFGTPVPVVKGTLYHLAIDQDFSITYNVNTGTTSGWAFTTAYASFPAAGPSTSNGSAQSQAVVVTINITPTVNAELVNETQQDGTTSYVYDATVGHADLYNVADLPTNVLSIVAMTTRAYMEKSDAGARTGRVQLKSGATTVTGDLVLSSSFSWCSRTDTVDPNTSAAWTLANANAAQCGVVVAA
jgi:hypothetical protein